MKQRIILSALVVAVTVGVWLLWQKPSVRPNGPASPVASVFAKPLPTEEPSSGRKTNRLGDTLTDAQDAEFVSKVFPKFREFVAALNRIGVSPFDREVSASECSKIRIIHTPNGIICPFVIGDGWTADYMRSDSFEGITHFGQRGPDNPFRAISRADTVTLKRLSERAVPMSSEESWKIANQVSDSFGIEQARFEKPQMHEEALFEYRLGLQTIRYRAKGSDPLNQMNYTRSFTLKATSPTTAVLVRYSNLEAR